MAKLVDALVSGTSDRKVVQVRVLFWAPKQDEKFIPQKAGSPVLGTKTGREVYPAEGGKSCSGHQSLKDTKHITAQVLKLVDKPA